jgi:ParB-like chromosome segregation protein Spo0J
VNDVFLPGFECSSGASQRQGRALSWTPRKDPVSALSRDDAPWNSLREQLGGHQTYVVPIDALLPADSPRLEGESEDHARSLAESGAALPPIVVHWGTMRVVDGMHRLRATVLRGDTRIEARLVQGTVEEMFALAVELNSEHGLPLRRQDRIAAAVRILESHPHWSDRRIASVTGLSAGTVAPLRSRAGATVPEQPLRTGRDGRARPVDAAAGRIAASRIIEASPHASLREIARRAGVAVATARDVRNRMLMGQDPLPPKFRPTGDGYPADAGADGGPPPEPEPAAGAEAGTGKESVLARMRRDPSLRMSQTGRTLLYLLGTHLLTDEQRRAMIAGVPAHRTADVARAARLCAERWLQFAVDLEGRRTRDESGAPGRGKVASLSPGA